MSKRVFTPLLVVLATGMALALTTPARATVWCGENGLIRFSFSEGDSLVSVLDNGPAENGVTRIDLYAWLTDVDGVKHDGEVLTALGAFELSLEITGAEAFILKQEFPSEGFNVGQGQGNIAFGLHSGLGFKHGRTLLVHWQIMFQGRPENVRFGLDPEKLVSCAKTEGCSDGHPQALYVGSASSNLLNMMFGAGYQPAWLNPTAEPDCTPVHGHGTWQEVGVFKPR